MLYRFFEGWGTSSILRDHISYREKNMQKVSYNSCYLTSSIFPEKIPTNQPLDSKLVATYASYIPTKSFISMLARRFQMPT
jgi:hypothetical protein